MKTEETKPQETEKKEKLILVKLGSGPFLTPMTEEQLKEYLEGLENER